MGPLRAMNNRLSGVIMILGLPLMMMMSVMSHLIMTQVYIEKTRQYWRIMTRDALLHHSIQRLYGPFIDDLIAPTTCPSKRMDGMHTLSAQGRTVWVYRCMVSDTNRWLIHYGIQ